MLAADQIRRRIAMGELRTGQRLEASRVLARELQVSLPVVREALAALAYAGVIDVRHGVGVFVARRRPKERAFRLARRHAADAELHELRKLLAAATAERAARTRQTARRIEHLGLLLEERSPSLLGGDPSWFTRADLEFHSYVAALGGGPLQGALDHLAGTALWNDLSGRARNLALNRELEHHHAALVSAIEGRNPEGASRAAHAIASIEAVSSG